MRESQQFAIRAMCFAAQAQEGQLDDIGGGVASTKSDGQLARFHRYGIGILLAGDEPLISLVVLLGSDGIAVRDITTSGDIEKDIAAEMATDSSQQSVSLGQDEEGYYLLHIPATITVNAIAAPAGETELANASTST